MKYLRMVAILTLTIVFACAKVNVIKDTVIEKGPSMIVGTDTLTEYKLSPIELNANESTGKISFNAKIECVTKAMKKYGYEQYTYSITRYEPINYYKQHSINIGIGLLAATMIPTVNEYYPQSKQYNMYMIAGVGTYTAGALLVAIIDKLRIDRVNKKLESTKMIIKDKKYNLLKSSDSDVIEPSESLEGQLVKVEIGDVYNAKIPIKDNYIHASFDDKLYLENDLNKVTISFKGKTFSDKPGYTESMQNHFILNEKKLKEIEEKRYQEKLTKIKREVEKNGLPIFENAKFTKIPEGFYVDTLYNLSYDTELLEISGIMPDAEGYFYQAIDNEDEFADMMLSGLRSSMNLGFDMNYEIIEKKKYVKKDKIIFSVTITSEMNLGGLGNSVSYIDAFYVSNSSKTKGFSMNFFYKSVPGYYAYKKAVRELIENTVFF